MFRYYIQLQWIWTKTRIKMRNVEPALKFLDTTLSKGPN